MPFSFGRDGVRCCLFYCSIVVHQCGQLCCCTFFKKTYFILKICVPVWVCVRECRACRGQKRASDPLALEFHGCGNGT